MSNSAFTVIGTSANVVGTAGQIDVVVSGGTATVSIDAGYVGQTSIVTLGTVTTGVWSATPITIVTGGTGVASFTPYSIICGGTTSTGALQNVSGLGTAGQVLTSAGASALPTWGNIGTVTSVSITSSTLLVTGGPITTSGTIDIELSSGLGGNNMVLNGDFQVAQAGNSIGVGANVFAYTLDRWQIQTTPSQTCTVSQIAGATSGSYLCQVVRNSGQTGTGQILFGTSLTRDMCIGAANSTVTVTFNAYKLSGYTETSSALTVFVGGGIGSSDNSNLNTANTNWTTLEINQSFVLTTSPQSFTFTSSTLASDITQLSVIFAFNPIGTAPANDGFVIGNVKLELGSFSTVFNHESLAQVLPQCYRFRYYQISSDSNYFGVGFANSTSAATIFMPFPVQMQAVPSLQLAGSLSDYTIVKAGGGTESVSGISASSSQYSSILTVSTSSLTAGGGLLLQNTVSGGGTAFMGWLAELT